MGGGGLELRCNSFIFYALSDGSRSITVRSVVVPRLVGY